MENKILKALLKDKSRFGIWLIAVVVICIDKCYYLGSGIFSMIRSDLGIINYGVGFLLACFFMLVIWWLSLQKEYTWSWLAGVASILISFSVYSSFNIHWDITNSEAFFAEFGRGHITVLILSTIPNVMFVVTSHGVSKDVEEKRKTVLEQVNEIIEQKNEALLIEKISAFQLNGKSHAPLQDVTIKND